MQIKAGFLLLCLFVSAAAINYACADQPMIVPGNTFPELSLKAPENLMDRQYLGLTEAETFTPSKIKTEVLLVEYLNVHCPHCQMQTYSYNELYRQIEKDPATRGQIKMLGIAAGNLESEVTEFRRDYRIDFPIIADPTFTYWHAIGGDATPFSLYVRQDQGKPGIVTATHIGLNTHYSHIFRTLNRMRAKDVEDFRQQAQTARKQKTLIPILSAAEIEYRVRSAFTQFGQIEQFSKLSLLSGRQVYSALLITAKKRERLFAEVSSRASICDICHDVHFIYLFDSKTRIIGFESLHLTRLGNVDWNAQEIQKMRSRVIGRYLSKPQPFDPSVDAVTAATMTSAIIFDSLAQGETLISELRDRGLL